MFSNPHMGLVAEAGPETIIPLSPGKRGRGFDLWQQAGRILGVTPYADGDIVGTVPAGTKSGININVQLSPSFTVEGDGNIAVDKIKAMLRELADELSEEMAIKLEKVFSNMPA